MQNTIICLMGPTASGKTDLSLQLAEELNAEIISVDSAMVYKGLDIGTAKPDWRSCPIRHHLIDLNDPSEPYSAANFQRDALEAIANILARGKMPLLVGGTMLYFKALQDGLSPLPSADDEVRARLAQEAREYGWQALHDRLRDVDPVTAERIKPTDPQRIQRALEVYELTGQPLSALWEIKPVANQFNFINLALWPEDRTLLHDRIAKRFTQMLADGFIDEVQRLYHRADLHPDLPAIRSVGYRQAWQFLERQLTQEEMVAKAVTATRQLAKRQLTWLRSWEPMCYVNPFDSDAYQLLKTKLDSQLA